MNYRREKSKLSANKRRSIKVKCISWFIEKWPLLLFVLKFGFLIILFYILSFTHFFESVLYGSTVANARLSGAILNLFGEHCGVSGATLWAGNEAIITVLPVCSAFEFFLFFCAAVLAFPAALHLKMFGIAIGTISLFGLNVIRVMSLYFVGVHFRGLFDAAHEEIWGALLLIGTIFLCGAWISCVRRYETFKVKLDTER